MGFISMSRSRATSGQGQHQLSTMLPPARDHRPSRANAPRVLQFRVHYAERGSVAATWRILGVDFCTQRMST